VRGIIKSQISNRLTHRGEASAATSPLGSSTLREQKCRLVITPPGNRARSAHARPSTLRLRERAPLRERVNAVVVSKCRGKGFILKNWQALSYRCGNCDRKPSNNRTRSSPKLWSPIIWIRCHRHFRPSIKLIMLS